MIDKEILDAIIEDLIDTPQSLEEACISHGVDCNSFDHEDMDYIDSQAFICNDCGWWTDRSDEAFDNVCIDCVHSWDDSVHYDYYGEPEPIDF